MERDATDQGEVALEAAATALRAGGAVAWCGAGLSMLSGYPSWGGLVGRMADAVSQALADGTVPKVVLKALYPSRDPAAEIKALLKAKDYEGVIDHCWRLLGRHRYRQVLEEIFTRANSEADLAPSRRLLALPWALVVTTNYDRLLDEAYAAVFGGHGAIFSYADALSGPAPGSRSKLTPAGSGDPTPMLKIHWDLDPLDSLVLSGCDYARLIYADHAVLEAIGALMATRTVVFIGSSLTDRYLQPLMALAWPGGGDPEPRHVAIMGADSVLSAEPELRRRVRLCPYTHRAGDTRFPGLAERLEALAAGVGA